MKIKLRALRIALVTVGALGLTNTLIISTLSSLNLGVLLPAIIGAPLLICGLFLPGLARITAQGIGRAIKRVCIAGYAILFAAFAATWILIDVKAAAYSMDEEADVIIVLGAGLRGETPTLVLQKRLNTVAEYLRRHPDAVAVLSGGQGSGEHISEAEAMARYLDALGIEERRYIKEDQSTNTRENFAFSYALIKEHYAQDVRIAFVTTDFHVLRAKLVANKQGIETNGIAAPDVWYISVNNHLRECVALWGYAVTGGI